MNNGLTLADSKRWIELWGSNGSQSAIGNVHANGAAIIRTLVDLAQEQQAALETAQYGLRYASRYGTDWPIYGEQTLPEIR